MKTKEEQNTGLRWRSNTSTSCPSRLWSGLELFPVYQESVTKDKTRTSVGCINSDWTKMSAISPVLFLAICNILFGITMGEEDHLFSKLREYLQRVCSGIAIGNSNTVIMQIPQSSLLNHVHVSHIGILVHGNRNRKSCK